MKIEYYNDCDAIDLLYQTGFRQVLHIDACLSEPTYVFDEDKWKKVYHFDVVAPEFMLDTLHTLPLHDYILIDGVRVYDVSVSYTWMGRFAHVDITFSCGYYLRGDNLNIAPLYTSAPPGTCFEPGIEIRGVVSEEGTDDGIWLLYTESGSGYYIGELYGYFYGQRTTVPISEGEGVYDVSTDEYYFYDGIRFHKYPWITLVEQVGMSSYRVWGFAFPETFVYTYYRQVGTVDWTSVSPIGAATFMEDGITVNTVVANDYEWKIESKHHSCEYGTTDPHTHWTGYILINDIGHYITQNADGDRLYR